MSKKLWSPLLVFIFLFCLCSGCGSQPVQEKKRIIRIAAAASLEKALVQGIIPAFTAKNTSVELVGTYDASGRLQKQIEQGMQADVFISAGVRQMAALEQKGYLDKGAMEPLLENKLVLIVPVQDQGSIGSFEDISRAKRPAIGDPSSVPAGQYAQEVLNNLQLWKQLESRLSLGTNVVQVLNWVAEGSADAGIVYASDAANNKKVRVVGEAPKGSLKNKVIYPVAVLKQSAQPKLAQELVKFLHSEEAEQIFREFGFAVAK